MEKISLLKAQVRATEEFFVSHRHKSCIFPVLVPKDFQIISNAVKMWQEI